MDHKIHRYLALGDSYTIGEKVSPPQCWPDQLVQRLKLTGLEISKPTIIAATGWTTCDLLNALEKAKLRGAFDLVTLLIGVNNQYQDMDLEDYRSEFTQLLHQAISFTRDRSHNLVVLSIPDWSVTPFASGRDRILIKAQIEHFNRVNREETQLARANYLDVTNISRQADNDPSLLTVDGLHPSEKMYSQWADLVFPATYKILSLNLEETHEPKNIIHN